MRPRDPSILPRSFSQHTLRLLLLVPYGTGLLAGEALRLRFCDVDVRDRLLTVWDTKFFKSRLVPIGIDLNKALARYGSEWTRLTSRLQSFETGVLTQEDNLAGLAALNRELVARVEAIASARCIVFDMDSTEVAVYGQQQESAYNGHFESTSYHPLLLFNRERATASPPNCGPTSIAPTAGKNCCCPRLNGQQALGKEVVFWADTAFAGAVLGVEGTRREVRDPPSRERQSAAEH